MKKYNLYRIDVDFVKGKRTEKHCIYVAARNVKTAFSKASARLTLAPHGIGNRNAIPWRLYLTGHYDLMGKVII